MNHITDLIARYTCGEATLRETNEALKTAGATFYLDPGRNTIAEDERDRYGLLDTGTGTMDKVEVENMRLKHADCGKMHARCIFQGETYWVEGSKLVPISAGNCRRAEL